jgi:pilus assembly protein Flp/PilA
MLFTAASYVSSVVTKIVRREEGATLVEYGLLIALIALACVGGIGLLSGGISDMFTNLGNSLTGKGTV